MHVHLNDTIRGTLTVWRLIIKSQKVGGGPISVNLCPFPKIFGISSNWLAYKITQPIETNYLHTLGPLSPSELGLYFAYGMFIYLNTYFNLSFTLPWITLEFFPVQSQGPSFVSPSEELTGDRTLPFSLALSPATKSPSFKLDWKPVLIYMFLKPNHEVKLILLINFPPTFPTT